MLRDEDPCYSCSRAIKVKTVTLGTGLEWWREEMPQSFSF
jgi:hypothetical protein